MAKRVQVFVAGALALIGYRALAWLPTCFAFHDAIYVVGCIGVGLGLPLGIIILCGRLRPAWLAESYLLSVLAVMSVSLFVTALNFIPPEAMETGLSSVSDWIVVLALLLLLLWSRFPRQEQGAEPAAAPSGGPGAQAGKWQATEGPPSVS